jgi:hypothetical protein
MHQYDRDSPIGEGERDYMMEIKLTIFNLISQIHLNAKNNKNLIKYWNISALLFQEIGLRALTITYAFLYTKWLLNIYFIYIS